MSARAVVSLCLGAFLVVGCHPGAGWKPRVDTARIVDTIKTDEVRWNADFRSGDAGKIVRHFAPGAIVMHSGASPLVGSSAIEPALSQLIEQPGFSFTFSSDRVDVAASGDLAAARGTYRSTGADPRTGAPVSEAGSYVTLYKPGADGVWRAVWDISTPGPGAPPAATAH
jgi:ketosteroid isomerase-like protein